MGLRAYQKEQRGRHKGYKARGGITRSVSHNVQHPLIAGAERAERRAARVSARSGRLRRKNFGTVGGPAGGAVFRLQYQYSVPSKAAGAAYKTAAMSHATGNTEGVFKASATAAAQGAVGAAVQNRFGPTTRRVRRNMGYGTPRGNLSRAHFATGYNPTTGAYYTRKVKGKTQRVKKGRRKNG